MTTIYEPSLKAHLSVDANRKVRHIRHSEDYWYSEENIPRLSAAEYLRQLAGTYDIPNEQFRHLEKQVSVFDPKQQEVEYQLSEEKHLFDSSVVGYYQTYMNVPVWRKGLSVKVKQNPYRVVGSTNNSEDGLKGTLPNDKVMAEYRTLFNSITGKGNALTATKGEAGAGILNFLEKVLGSDPKTKLTQKGEAAVKASEPSKILNARAFMYKYDSKVRFAGNPTPIKRDANVKGENEEGRDIPFPELPAVPKDINEGQTYLVAEVILEQSNATIGDFVWLLLVELG